MTENEFSMDLLLQDKQCLQAFLKNRIYHLFSIKMYFFITTSEILEARYKAILELL